MSIQSWKDEFITHTGNLSTDGKNKWIGIRKENLKRHGLFQHEDDLCVGTDDPHQCDTHSVFNISECVLCDEYAEYGCVGCPLYIVRDDCSCDVLTKSEAEKGINPPYGAGVYGDPEPIIAWLEKAEEYERTQDSNT